jgi:hypothetical protein
MLGSICHNENDAVCELDPNQIKWKTASCMKLANTWASALQTHFEIASVNAMATPVTIVHRLPALLGLCCLMAD